MANERITALNGKFRNYKTEGLGERDATYRFGKNIPLDTPTNFSAGYSGGAIRDLSEKYTNEQFAQDLKRGRWR